MKKTYIRPVVIYVDVEEEEMIATSPKSASYTDNTQDPSTETNIEIDNSDGENDDLGESGITAKSSWFSTGENW